MNKNNLSEIVEKLSKKELAEIDKAVRSPFFNPKEDVTKLWEILQKNKTLPEKELLFQQMYGDEVFIVKKIYNATSQLLALVERVLFILEKENEPTTQKLSVSSWYRKKGLIPLFQTNINETQELLKKTGLEDDQFYRFAHQIDFEIYEHNIADRTSEHNLQSLNDSLDLSFLIEKLKKTCLLLSHQAVYKVNYQTGLLDSVLQYIENQPDVLQKPAVAVYYYCYLLQTQPHETAHFDTFKRLIIEHFAIFNSADIRALYLLAVNYCIKKHNAGFEKYAHEGLELYKKALKDDFLLENGVLSRFSYRNIVAWALLEKDYDWTERFITQYKNNLERTFRDSMFSFCLARLEYSRKNYEAALLLLQKAEYRDILLGLAAKVILLKIYYELDEFEVLEAHLNSMKAYLIRKRVLGYHKKNYQNIIAYTKKLMILGSNALEINTLRNAIEQEAILTEKEWFLEQLV
jgi:hypothetical protein